MRSARVTVAGWAGGLVALALIMVAYSPFRYTTGALPFLLLLGAAAVVALFAAIIGAAIHAERVGPQARQPRRAAAAVLAALTLAIGLAGAALGWWLSLFAIYPLLAAARSLGRDRVAADAQVWPRTVEPPPTGTPRLVHDGTAHSTTEQVDIEVRMAEELPPASTWMRRVADAVLAVVLARAVARNRRRR